MIDTKAQPIFGDKVALWYCAKCGNSGALDVDRQNTYDVIEGLCSHHQALTGNRCDAAIGSGGLRLIRPIDWYAVVATKPA